MRGVWAVLRVRPGRDEHVPFVAASARRVGGRIVEEGKHGRSVGKVVEVGHSGFLALVHGC